MQSLAIVKTLDMALQNDQAPFALSLWLQKTAWHCVSDLKGAIRLSTGLGALHPGALTPWIRTSRPRLLNKAVAVARGFGKRGVSSDARIEKIWQFFKLLKK